MDEPTRPTRTELGKIKSVSFGFGGYQNAEVGITFTLGGGGWGVGDFWGHWAAPPADYTQWTLEEQRDAYAETVTRIIALLKDAKVQSVSQLEGLPVEVTFSGSKLESWRVLKEVL